MSRLCIRYLWFSSGCQVGRLLSFTNGRSVPEADVFKCLLRPIAKEWSSFGISVFLRSASFRVQRTLQKYHYCNL